MALSTHLILCALVTRRLPPPPPESALRKQRQLWANPAQPPSRLLLINPPTPPSYNKSQHSYITMSKYPPGPSQPPTILPPAHAESKRDRKRRETVNKIELLHSGSWANRDE